MMTETHLRRGISALRRAPSLAAAVLFEGSTDATIDGRYERVSGTACRDACGPWRAVGS